MVRRRLWVLLLVGLIGCQQSAQPTARPLSDQRTTVPLTATAVALLPTATPEPTKTPTPTIQATAPVSATAQATPQPTVGAGTPTAQPSQPVTVGDAGFCHATFGANTQERFSSRLEAMNVQSASNADVLELTFAPQSGPIGGMVRCLTPNAASLLSATDGISSVIQIELPLWHHDTAWSSSILTLTKALRYDGLQHITTVAAQSSPSSAGAIVEIGLDQILPFSVKLTGSTLQVSVANSAGTLLNDDPLANATGIPTAPTRPILFASRGDLFSYELARVVPLSTTLEVESDFAISPNGAKVAFCRATPDVLPTQGALWISDIDGKNEQLIADVGGCVEPAWSFDGSSVWFVAPWSAATPPNYRLWQVATNGGEPVAQTNLDAWSRRKPQPLPDGRVVMLGETEGGRNAVIVTNGITGTTAVVAEAALVQYASINSVLVAPDGTSLAVEATRTTGGADLLVLDLQGKLVSSVTSNWWNRPLAWNNDGTLFYLASVCQSGAVLQYELHSLKGSSDTIITKGNTLGEIGAAAVVDDALVYVRALESASVERGASSIISGASELWLYDVANDGRARIISATDGINIVR